MMSCMRTFSGLEVRLRPRGAGRFFSAAFLLVWLAFWVVGEAFVLGVLLAGGWTLFTGMPVFAGQGVPESGPALLVGLLLVGWFLFWTIGGIAALQEFLRLVAGQDRLVARPDGLWIERGRGPFRSRRTLPRSQLRAIYRLPTGRALYASTTAGTLELTGMGSPADLAEIEQRFCAEMGLPDDPSTTACLPGAWREIRVPEGGTALVKDPAARRRRAFAALGVALVLAAGALAVWVTVFRDSKEPVAAILLALVTALVAWGALWLAVGRREWRIESGRIILCRRFGGSVSRRFEGRALSFRSSKDSDGDTWYELLALAANEGSGVEEPGRRARRRVIQRTTHDPTELRQLGRWLAARNGMVLFDEKEEAVRVAPAREPALAHRG